MKWHFIWYSTKKTHSSFRESKELRKREKLLGTNWDLPIWLGAPMFLILRTLAPLSITVSLISMVEFSSCIPLGRYNRPIPCCWALLPTPTSGVLEPSRLVQESPLQYFQELVVKQLVACKWPRWGYLFMQWKPANLRSPPLAAGC